DARFEVVGTTLKLKAGVSLDFQAAHTVNVIVTAKDAGNLTKAQSFTIDVIGGNVAPTSITPDMATVAENAVFATSAVSGLAAVDPNVGDHAGLYLVNDAGGRFVMIGDKIVVANPALLDYEAGTSHTIEVKAIDTGGLSKTEAITINLGNLTGA